MSSESETFEQISTVGACVGSFVGSAVPLLIKTSVYNCINHNNHVLYEATSYQL